MSGAVSLPVPPGVEGASAVSSVSDTKQKRSRIPVSCLACRHRKLKCDRNQPCDKCVKRGLSSSCAYATPSNRNRPDRSHGSSGTTNMQSRIRHLENLVITLMKKDHPDGDASAMLYPKPGGIAQGTSLSGSMDFSEFSGSHDTPYAMPSIPNEKDVEVGGSFGRMSIDKSETTYVGASHWAAILNDITEVREYFEDHENDAVCEVQFTDADSPGSQVPDLIFGAYEPVTKADLLAALPPRPIADRFISRYFNSNDPAVQLIHRTAFQDEYESFFADPLGTSIRWYGLLFAIIGVAASTFDMAGEEPPELLGSFETWREVRALYRKRTIQCLILADYNKPGPHTVETLMVHFSNEYRRSTDAQVSVWILSGVCVRLAMRMGFHRDSDHYPNISVFEGEMRRRMWAMLCQIDILVSFQVGLPVMVRESHYDTKLPRNLYDEDFDQNTTVLPPERPESDSTPVSYTNTKASIMYAFGLIMEQTYAMAPVPYEELLKLDKLLRERHARIPAPLRMRSMDRSITDGEYLIIRRFNIELLYQKSLCVLHRKYLASARSSQRYAYSRRSCVDAALELLGHQAALHRETQPGGQLCHARWYVSSLTVHNFLVAAMIICLDLYHCTDSAEQSSGDISVWGYERRDELENALQISYSIWKESSEHSTEALKSCQALGAMLARVKGDWNTEQNVATETGEKPSIEDALAAYQDRPVDLSSSSLVEPAAGVTAQNTTTARSEIPRMEDEVPEIDIDAFGNTSFAPFGEMIDVPENFDWDMFDSQFQGYHA